MPKVAAAPRRLVLSGRSGSDRGGYRRILLPTRVLLAQASRHGFAGGRLQRRKVISTYDSRSTTLMDAMEPLRLVALDQEDLAVLSAHLQDAVIRIADLAYLPAERRFALCARRFDWEAPSNEPRRRLTGLHFNRVDSARTREIDRSNPDGIMSLLAITFQETSAPSGTLTLLFSEGGAIQLDVECIEAQMKDLGPIWEAEGRPVHDLDVESA